MKLFRPLVLLVMMFMTLSTYAAIEERSFDDPAMLDRYHSLIEELRCLVCQNQNLADSNADLARDLRDKTAEMLEQGKTDQEILDYMSERYGDFVLYRPPFRSDTALLWLGPVGLLIIVFVGLIRFLRRRKNERQTAENTLDDAAQQQVRDLLAKSTSDQ